MSKPKGKRVEILNYDPPVEAEVVELLAVQFIAEHPRTGTWTYLFYNDKDVTWRDVNG